jgi:8-oxo-dGTP diphosphatase
MNRHQAVIVLKDEQGKILLQHRDEKAPRYPNCWGFFGGGIEEGETPEKALKREAKEELGIDLENYRFFKKYELKDNLGPLEEYVFVVPLNVPITELKLGEGKGLRLFSCEEIKKIEVPGYEKSIFKDLCNIQGKRIVDFEEKKNKSVRLTQRTFKQFYPIYEESLSTLLRVVDILIKEVEYNKDSLFNKATLLLLSRSIQHLESILLLTENGLYGDAWVIARGVLSDMSMLYYLHFRPELIEMFLKEEGDDYQLNKRFRKLFNETVIQEELQQHGLSSPQDSFQKISKAAHASSWGAQFYGTRAEKKGQYHLKYGPGFETEKALAILAAIISAHWDYLNTILWHRHHNKLDISSPEWEKIKDDVLKLEIEVTKFSTIGMSVLFEFKDRLKQES